MNVPKNPKIYHICHVDRLTSILSSGSLWGDAKVAKCNPPGTVIGMREIKRRRLEELRLRSCPRLYVGDCVPFYFCPRSVMLYIIHKGNHLDIDYKGGQESIIHLEADLRKTIKWADENGKCWAFTNSNAGSKYFRDFASLGQLDMIDWDAISAKNWSSCKEGKQAEFLLEDSFPLDLVDVIGVCSEDVCKKALDVMLNANRVNKPDVKVIKDWYY